VQVYRTDGGSWLVYPATMRYATPAPAWPAGVSRWPPPEPEGDACPSPAWQAWAAAWDAYDQWGDTVARLPITLPYAGEVLRCATAAACLARVEALVGLGYRVPACVVEALREDAARLEGRR
jgi:hypothetical protein